MGQHVAIYCRVSTSDQSCERQARDLTAFAARSGDEVVAVFKETGSGVKHDRTERKKLLALSKARGKKLGRQLGERPKSDRLAPKVMALQAEGRSYRWIARDLGLSKNTVMAIVQRHRQDNN